MIDLVVDSRARLRGRVPEECLAEVRAEFTHENPAWTKLKQMGYPTYSEPRLFKMHREQEYVGRDGLRGQEISVPRGGIARLRAILSRWGVHFAEHDDRTLGEASLVRDAQRGQIIPDHSVQLRGYQEAAIEAAIEAEGGLLVAPTGSGKTTNGFAIASRLNVPTLVVVWNGALFEQWIDRAQKELGLKKGEIGVIRAGKVRLEPLTIAMQQSLHKILTDDAHAATRREVLEFPGLLFVDEIQRCPASTVAECIDPFPARYRFGTSADHSRKDRKEALTYDLIGPVVHEIQREQLIDDGHVLDVEVRVVLTNFSAPLGDDYGALVEAMTKDEERNTLVEDILVREAAVEGRQVVALTHRIGHALVLDATATSHGIASGAMLGGPHEEKRYAETLAGLRAGTVRVGTATIGAFGTGIDVPSLGVGILCTPLGTNRQLFNQVRGRFCRRDGNKEARLYYLYDHRVFGWSQLRNLVKWNRTVVVQQGGEWVPAREFLRRKAA